MSRSLAIVLIALVHSATNLFGQDPVVLSRTVFKLSPQHFTQNALKAGIERFNRDHSTSFAVFITGRLDNYEESLYDRGGYEGLAGELQLRKYVSPMKSGISRKGHAFHQGIYAGVYLQGGSYSGEFSERFTTYDPNTGTYQAQTRYDYKENIGNWGLGFSIGYQKTLWQVIFLEAFIGGGAQFSDRIVSGVKPESSYIYSDITDPGYKGILPKIGVSVGIGL